MPILAAFPPRSLTEFTNLPQIPQVLPPGDKSTSTTAKKPVDFLSKSGYNKLDGAPDLGTSTTDNVLREGMNYAGKCYQYAAESARWPLCSRSVQHQQP